MQPSRPHLPADLRVNVQNGNGQAKASQVCQLLAAIDKEEAT
jgi:hypothetical protein